jgi:hypothetical protein
MGDVKFFLDAVAVPPLANDCTRACNALPARATHDQRVQRMTDARQKPEEVRILYSRLTGTLYYLYLVQ